MRYSIVLAAVAALSACDASPAERDPPSVVATPASASWDGADYADQAAKLAHGKRLARLLDCTGCHGEDLRGKNVTADEPDYGDMNAPNLTLKMADYSDSEFASFMRTGTPRDGRDLWFMPVESYQFLSERDLDALTAFLRTFKPAGTQLPPIRKGAGFLEEIREGGIGHAAQQVARLKANPPPDLGPEHERGRQLARMACTGCHNGQLEGYRGFTPNLDVAGAYLPAELTELLTTGKGKAKADLGLMTAVSRFSFSQLTQAERRAIVGYVLARANRRQSPQ